MMESFGQLLRKYRGKTYYPPKQKALSQGDLADLLGDELGTSGYSTTAVSNWELGKSQIHKDERLVLVSLVKILHRFGGITSLDEADAFLETGLYARLSHEEIALVSSEWQRVDASKQPVDANERDTGSTNTGSKATSWMVDYDPMQNAASIIGSHVAKRDERRAHRNREIMLKKVESYWVEGLLENSLHGAVLLQLGMGKAPEMVEHPWDTVLHRHHRPDELLPKNTRIIEVFDLFGGAFLILGEPGSGKTTALLELCSDLIDRARNDPFHPIPVVFNLSSWAETRKPLEEWLQGELNSKYHIPLSIAEMWIIQNELLLLLDGLDEVRETYRSQCVEVINTYRTGHMDSIVVCSRTIDYQALETRLTLSGAIIQQPLSNEQIDRYLQNFGEKLASVREAVKSDPTLQQLARSPLVLSIISLAYEDASFNELRFNTLDEGRDHLFTAYVRRMFSHRQVTGCWSADDIVDGMVWLSRLLNEKAQTVFHIESLQPHALSSVVARNLYSHYLLIVFWLLIAVPLGFSCGLAVYYLVDSTLSASIIGISFGLSGAMGLWMAMVGDYRLRSRITLGTFFAISIGLTIWTFVQSVWISIVLGMTVGLVVVIAYRRIGYTEPAEPGWDSVTVINTTKKRVGWSWRTGRIGFLKRVPFGLVFGTVSGIVAGIAFGWMFGLVVGLAFGITMPAMGSLSHGVSEINIEPISKPNEGIRRSLENGIRFGIVSGIWFGLVFGTIEALLTNSLTGIIVGCGFFFSGFTMAWTVAGGYTVLQHGILRILLSINENVPLRYAEFLNNAVHHILLRRVGSGYIFVHRLLLEHFASRQPDSLRFDSVDQDPVQRN